MLFDQLNKLSEIPIHRSNKKRSKIGSGVVYYNNVNDLLDRLELLGDSSIAGNNGVQSELSQIAQTLNKLGTINNEQLSEVLKEYVIYHHKMNKRALHISSFNREKIGKNVLLLNFHLHYIWRKKNSIVLHLID